MVTLEHLFIFNSFNVTLMLLNDWMLSFVVIGLFKVSYSVNWLLGDLSIYW